jgi:geranylgeranyl diphosphate synthase type II
MDKYIIQIADHIEESLMSGIKRDKRRLNQALYYAVSIRGKRLRPLLFLSLLKSFGIDPLEYLDIACAIEYIHTYSLIHDDLPAMDNDDLRRGQPTVHIKFDEPIALLAGDTLLTVAFERITKAALDPDKVVKILRILTESIGIEGMAGGQALDLDFNGNKEDIIEIHKKKTACLICGALLSAGSIIGLSEREMSWLEKAGMYIGIAFQMADDLLDVEGEEKKVGKRLKKDKGNESPNSVLYFGVDTIRERIDDYYNKTMEMFEKLGVAFPSFLLLIKKMVYRNK